MCLNPIYKQYCHYACSELVAPAAYTGQNSDLKMKNEKHHLPGKLKSSVAVLTPSFLFFNQILKTDDLILD